MPELEWRTEPTIENLETELESLNPVFPFHIAWPKSYDDLFEGRWNADSNPEDLLKRATFKGRVLLHAEGGTGKSTLIKRLFISALDRGLNAVIVDLVHWNPPMFRQWEQWRDNSFMRMELLLTELGRPRSGQLELSRKVSKGIIFVDGLNEVPNSVGQSILSALDAFARRNPTFSVVVADRLVRRRISPDDWALATIGPFSEADIRAVLGDQSSGETDLVSSAFFLNLAVQSGISSATAAASFRTYFRNHIGLSSTELRSCARGAFRAYLDHSSRVFNRDELFESVGGLALRKLQDSGTLRVEGSQSWFRHHLFHDYLASNWMAARRATWTRSSFDSVTFKASSFDVLALAIQQIRKVSKAEDFLLSVYDWNYYASAYALAKSKTLGQVRVSNDMESVLLALLAEKRWDLTKHTQQEVNDALRLASSGIAAEFLAAENLDEVVEMVRRMDYDDQRLVRWQHFFASTTGDEAAQAAISALQDSESLIGWTAANLIRRTRPDSAQIDQLIAIAHTGDSPTIRWRAVHALGRHGTEETYKAVLRATEDSDHWVRYGAIRSLIEMAALSDSLREPILQELGRRVKTFNGDALMLTAFERSLVLTSPPPNWAEAVEPVLESLWANAKSVETQDRWRRAAFEVERSFLANQD